MNLFCSLLCCSAIAVAPIGVTLGSGVLAAQPPPSSAQTALRTTDTWPIASDPTHRILFDGAPNFGKLNGVFWRSGQPTRNGYLRLSKQGLKTVVNLREEFPKDKELIPPGVNFIFMPIPDGHEPSDAQAALFVKTASNPDNWPLLVHCRAGEGRTGVMAALMRCTLDQWELATVMKEVSNFRVKRMGLFVTPMNARQQAFISSWHEDMVFGDKPKNTGAVP